MALELVVAVDPREAQQHVREHRVAGRRRVVVEVLRAHDERLAVGGREEEAAALVVSEQLDREQREAARLLEPAQLAGGDVQLVEAVRDVRVVVEVAGAGRPALAVAAPQAALVRQRAEQELREPAAVVSQSSRSRRLAASASAASASPFHDAIALSSSPGCGRVAALLEQPRAQLGIELAADDRATVLERLEQLRGHALLGRPRVREPLDAVGVGVLGRRERALGQQEVAEHVVHGLLDHLAIALAAGDEPRVEIRGDEQRVVVEHLLEVRDEPAVVDRVAVEAAADEVVHAAGGHPVERPLGHLQLASPQQELEHRVRRELRRPAEAAPLGVERRAQPAHRLAEQRLGERLRRRRAATRALDGLRRARRPSAPRPRGARGTRSTPPPAPAGSSAARGAAPAGSTCRRRTARPRA